jgi:hypothetical protein
MLGWLLIMNWKDLEGSGLHFTDIFIEFVGRG